MDGIVDERAYIRAMSRVFNRVVMAFAEASASPNPNLEVDAVTADPEHLAEHAREVALALLNSEQGGLQSIARFYRRRSGYVTELVVDQPFDDSARGIALAAGFGLIVSQARIDGYFVCAEAWIAVAGLDPAVDALALEDRMDRQEVVVVSAATPQAHIIRVYAIERDGSSVSLADSPSRLPLRLNVPALANLYEAPWNETLQSREMAEG